MGGLGIQAPQPESDPAFLGDRYSGRCARTWNTDVNRCSNPRRAARSDSRPAGSPPDRSARRRRHVLGRASPALREGDAGGVHAVFSPQRASRSCPGRSRCEHALPGLQSELRADELQLVALCVLERLGAAREDRARVGHRFPQEQAEEIVGDVVVVADCPPVALAAVPARATGGSARAGNAAETSAAPRRRRPRAGFHPTAPGGTAGPECVVKRSAEGARVLPRRHPPSVPRSLERWRSGGMRTASHARPVDSRAVMTKAERSN